MIGNLDERITFQEQSLSADGAGGQTKSWANLATTPTVWARVMPKSAGERFDDDRMDARGMYVFTVRNRSDLNEAMRIVWRSVNYDIRGIFREGNRMQYMKIEAERGV